MKLRELQQEFKRKVCDPSVKINIKIRGSKPFSVKKRFGIYQYAFRARMEESLLDDFSEVRKKVGKKSFDALVTEFLKEFPSTHASLAEVSGNFPEFLLLKKRRALAQLAQMEWEQILSRLSEVPFPTNLELLQTLGPSEFNAVIFELHPSVRLLEFDFRVASDFMPGKTRVVIHFSRGESLVQPLSLREWSLLCELKQGCSIENLHQVCRKLKVKEEVMGKWFMQWAKDQIIWRVRLTRGN